MEGDGMVELVWGCRAMTIDTITIMNQPNVQNMNPSITGFGHYVGTNNGGSESNMGSPPPGKETGGSMTSM